MCKEKRHNILVTGGNGFIGNKFIKFVEQNQIGVKQVVRGEQNVAGKSIFRVSEINAETCWEGAFNNIDSILHLAGVAHNKSASDDYYRDVNTLGTLKMASEAANSGVKRFVFVSSIGVNGSFTDNSSFSELMNANPQNSYTKSKHIAEKGLFELSKKTGMEVVIVRPTLVYGKEAPGNFRMLKKLVSKAPILPFGLVNNKRSYISVDNLSDFLFECSINPLAANQLFVISEGGPVSTKEFTNAIAKGMRTKLRQLPVPVSLLTFFAKLIGKSKQVNQLTGDLDVDSSKARDLLSWTPPETMEQAMDKLK